MSIGIALVGAGIFAREEHLPAIEASTTFTLKAVYSRSQKSAEALASSSKTAADVYFDSPATSSNSFDDLLARDDIGTVIICVPITKSPPLIQKALKAGKHVLSEKPIAKDVATANLLIEFYNGLEKRGIWAVGENLRFVDAIVSGAQKVKEVGGEIVTFRLEMFTKIGDDDKFFNTEWRKVPEYQGGFLLDGGVHFVAVLRLSLAAAGEDVASVTAHTTLLEQKLAPVDTVHSVWRTTSGRSGTFSVSFGTEFKGAFEIQVITTKGAITITPMSVAVTTKGADGEKKEDKVDFPLSFGVKQEIQAFGESIEAGKVNPMQSPEEALKDLAILEGMLKSGETGSLSKL